MQKHDKDKKSKKKGFYLHLWQKLDCFQKLAMPYNSRIWWYRKVLHTLLAIKTWYSIF